MKFILYTIQGKMEKPIELYIPFYGQEPKLDALLKRARLINFAVTLLHLNT